MNQPGAARLQSEAGWEPKVHLAARTGRHGRPPIDAYRHLVPASWDRGRAAIQTALCPSSPASWQAKDGTGRFRRGGCAMPARLLDRRWIPGPDR